MHPFLDIDIDTDTDIDMYIVLGLLALCTFVMIQSVRLEVN